MKASFENGLAGYRGKYKQVVYCYNKRLGICYVRKRSYPTLTENNHQLGSITANLHSIRPSNAWKDDMRNYIWRYNAMRGNEKKQIYSWVNLYLTLMRAMARQDSSIDLLTLTRSEIYERNLPCITLRQAVEAELLIPVYNWQDYNAEI